MPARSAPNRSADRPRTYRGQPRRKQRKGRRWFWLILLALLLGVLWSKAESIRDFLDIPEFEEKDVPSVTGLHPVVAAKQKELITTAARQGIRVVITDGFRSSEEQETLYQQGRNTSGKIVTYARGGQSYHNYGLAIDFALKTKAGKIIWDMDYDGNKNGKADWLEVVAIAKKLGFEWGGDWTDFPDYPHLQMDFGLSISQLKRGVRPPEDASP
ncbi:peptidase M15 [Paenibacillus sp. CAA11]|nr:peptidase M15 [Paenibacillus sp. CAA11]